MGSRSTSIRYSERLAQIGATPPIGTVGDSYDNALAETENGSYKTELVRGPTRPRPWRTVEDLELATLGWTHWHNTRCLQGYLGDVPPAEFEQAFYADHLDPAALLSRIADRDLPEAHQRASKSINRRPHGQFDPCHEDILAAMPLETWLFLFPTRTQGRRQAENLGQSAP